MNTTARLAALRTSGWALAAVALSIPLLDDRLSATMSRLILVEMPAWILLGWLAGRRWRALRPAWNPHGLTGLVGFLGTLMFWMIPRSVDAIGSQASMNQLMHLSLLAAAALLSMSVQAMPFVLRTALGIYAASMTFALGMLYSKFSAILCGTFNLAQQRVLGTYLLWVTPAVAVPVLIASARALARIGPQSATDRPRDSER